MDFKYKKKILKLNINNTLLKIVALSFKLNKPANKVL